MVNALAAGTFDSEAHWRDVRMSRLPALHDRERERIVAAMDELLFPLCSEGDALVTRFPMEEAHKAYLARIGFPFMHYSLKAEETGGHVFEALASDNVRGKELAVYSRLIPFSVVPGTLEAAAKYGWGPELPSLEAVKLVNSKIYSTRLNLTMFGQTRGKPVYSSQELKAAGGELLQQYGALLIKDPYGVSGKGNMLIQSIQALNRAAAYIWRQEEAGCSTAFVLEPYLPVERDFSCQFEIDAYGRFRFVSIQKMVNRQFAYLGSVSATEEELESLKRTGYFDVMMQAADGLYRDGYFGPVCIDSMSLRDGTVVPIVEVNARHSMGFINHGLDRVLADSGKKGFLTFRSLGFRLPFDYEAWLSELKREHLLYPNRKGNGIVPLSSATLLVNAHSYEPAFPEPGGGLCKGRLYMSVVADDDAEADAYLERMKMSFERKGGRWYD
ncbi:hypothetical protein KP806_09000 [Paenibacillus sp. N4]|uniref:hypothetical protein n=1 Tax=Paenibacillus vietnamensis TaxID=2590547 RepID=UPI001CD05148|nr:hypothetical protein [Paenibacillus vietnamensis]MCA0755185.1 hypothetical protein [Paenibacillus vietnamensis]